MLQRLKIQKQQKISQNQKLSLSPNIRLCLKILKLPYLELKQFLLSQIESNYLLEFDFYKSHKKNLHHFQIFSHSFSSQSLDWQQYNPSLFEHLIKQANEVFKSKKTKNIAEIIIGNVNQKGYLAEKISSIAHQARTTRSEIEKILHIIQRFDPIGIASCSLQECLLIQALEKYGEKSLPYRLLKFHFDDLLHYRISKILKKINVSKEILNTCIKKEIASLSLRPGSSFLQQTIQPVIADIEIYKEKDSWTIKIIDEDLPQINFNEKYIKYVLQINDVFQKRELKKLYTEALWLKKAIFNRSYLLLKIIRLLLKKQPLFFEEEKELFPLTIKEIALELNISQSTASRAIADKYIKVPFGIYPLRYFFSSRVKTEMNDMAQTSSLKILKEIIMNENKNKPYTDMQLMQQIKKQKIICARRTISKYRKLINVGSAKYRKTKT